MKSERSSSGIDFWEGFLAKERSFIKRYSVAIVLSFLSLLVAVIFQKIEGGAPFSSLAMLTVILTAIYGGKGPAFFDTLITSIGIDYFFSKPYFEVFDSLSSITRVLVYLLVGYLVGSLVDSLKDSFLKVREQKEMAELEKRARENVLGVVSHDLRSPLASILMNTDMLLRIINSGKPLTSAPRLVSSIKSSGQRMNRMIEDLLDAVKVEAGSFKVDKKETTLHKLLELALNESRPAAGAKHIHLELKLENNPLVIMCDEGRIIQVINNLVGNAIKFSPEHSEVSVFQTSTDDEVIINIADQGKGISKDEQIHLFDRYWQAPDTAHKGTGLGLFISKSIIELHGGKLKLESDIGSGSTFSIYLPKTPSS
ncbi:MAG: HAMP domain-containing histidine kinase [Bdellovibrionales bacterium]|nr:HAMP domain-containing histidine kinase [Bdellovibrionales bacterium]